MEKKENREGSTGIRSRRRRPGDEIKNIANGSDLSRKVDDVLLITQCDVQKDRNNDNAEYDMLASSNMKTWARYLETS